MKKIIQRIFVLTFTLSLTLLLTGIISRMLREKEINEKIAMLPSFSFMTLTNNDFHSSEIKKGPILIVRFHPECEHCQYEISQIIKSDIPSIASKVLLISSDDPDSIGSFLKQLNYSDCSSIKVLVDTSDSFHDIFGKDIVPSNYIYSKDLKLVKVLLGEVKTETIRKYLQISE
jgi:thiol-disulfide isomerase/thioredoxin